jgi:hypothetical protein
VDSFWKWLVSVGAIAGDPTYYSSGQAKPEEYTHALKVAMDFFKTNPEQSASFYSQMESLNLFEGDPNYYSSGSASPEDLSHFVDVVSANLASATPVGGGNASGTLLPIMTGDIQWYRDASGKYWAAYKLPYSERRAVFEATTEQLDSIFGAGVRPAATETTLDALLRNSLYTFSGSIVEVAKEGNFTAEAKDAITLAMNDGILPSWLPASGEVMDIIYLAEAENKSVDWTIDQIAKTASFTQRFGSAVDLFKQQAGLSTSDAVSAYLEYEQGVSNLLRDRGMDTAMAGPSLVTSLVSKGHSLDDVSFVFETFDRMEDNAESIAAFNEILVAKGLNPLAGAADVFTFMSGQAPKEMYDLWEASSVLEAATASGLAAGVSAEEAINMALKTPGVTTFGAALQGFTEASKLLLQFRSEVALDQYGLNFDDVVDMSLGLAPRSGQSVAELSMGMSRAVKAAQAFISGGVNPYTGFSSTGTPQQASLGGLRTDT